MNTHDEELLAELLIQWEELYERGQDSSPQELCRDCPHLIKELERRIAAMRATNWLNDPDCPADAPATASHQAQGKVLGGRYRLDDLIATGGFAEVWRAFDTELQRIVAIKLPKPSRLASATNFMTEARRVARLKHPGIVPVFDVGTEGSSCFIVSEYVEGGSLGDRLTKSPPSQKDTTRWLGEIAAALEYAHLHGVIHRDIKPANILIDHHGRALLADFGIAQSAQKTGAFAPSLGTLRYMSPEQLEGKPATPQSDVYSLGVVLHESLTGRVPYSSSEPSVLRREIVGGAQQLSRDVPVALLDVCKKAMQRLPHERHTSAAHFATDLERAVAQASPRRRWKTPLLWVVVFALSLIAFGFVYRAGLTPTQKPHAESVGATPSTATERPEPASTAEAAPPLRHPGPLPSITNSVGMVLIRIPAGDFVMGTPHDDPGHKENENQVRVVISQPYWIGQTEVTQAQWTKVMGDTPWVAAAAQFADGGHVRQDPMSAATFITWSSAHSFCRELTSLERKSGLISASVRYSLPTEAQWEYACRAGTTTRFSFGDAVSSLNEYAWWGYEVARGNCSDAPYVHNVAALKPNPWGLYDIHGNAWEWCSDWYGDSLPGGNDPQGVAHGTRRILRGGHWSFDETFCRSGDRSGSEPEYLNHSFGFRVVRVEDRVDDDTQQQAVSRLPSKINSIGMTLVDIPAGTFVMGSHCGQPNYTVRISRPFLMGATEVTNEQWLRVMGNVPSEWRDPDRPVENVSWADAVTFCRQLTTLPEERAAGMVYRLPTEAEWEYACRAGTTTRHWFGNDDSLVGNYAWLYLNARGTTHPVGKKDPNPWGLYDMRGNVWEWCSDWSDVTSHTSDELVIDPQGPTYSAESKRVVRGGSLGDNHDSFCSESPPETRSRGIGFRVVGVLEHVASP